MVRDEAVGSPAGLGWTAEPPGPPEGPPLGQHDTPCSQTAPTAHVRPVSRACHS